ncbi:hypothetical protein ACRAWF_20140 [Streptomyces sp. L7]
MGQHDDCVREVHDPRRRRARRHTRRRRGPRARRPCRRPRSRCWRVPPAARAVIDDATKKALYAQEGEHDDVAPAKVAKPIREVFVEDPDTAVAVARCAAAPRPSCACTGPTPTAAAPATRCGPDLRPPSAGAGRPPLRAFDPRVEHQGGPPPVEPAKHDFHDWPSCEAALESTPKS